MNRIEVENKVREYLERVGIVDRSQSDTFSEIQMRLGRKVFDELLNEKSEPGPEMIGQGVNHYDRMAHPIGDGSVYDFIISANYSQHLWQLSETLERLMEYQPADICDIGCGPGLDACLMALSLPESQVYGLDLSRGMIERANHRKTTLNLHNVNFFEGDRDNPPFDPYSFDLVSYNNCLTEGTPTQDFNYDSIIVNRLRVATKLLRKKGQLILTQPINPSVLEEAVKLNKTRLTNAGLRVNKEKRLHFVIPRLGPYCAVMLTATKK